MLAFIIQDDFSNYIDQVKLDPALLSRFDLMFAVEDKPDEEIDKKTITHIHKSLGIPPPNHDVLSTDFLRKYINHAKKIKPCMSDDVECIIVDWFLESRKIKDFHINFRHYDAIRRLSEGAARARLSTEVIEDDVNRAIRLSKYSLDSFGTSR